MRATFRQWLIVAMTATFVAPAWGQFTNQWLGAGAPAPSFPNWLDAGNWSLGEPQPSQILELRTPADPLYSHVANYAMGSQGAQFPFWSLLIDTPFALPTLPTMVLDHTQPNVFPTNALHTGSLTVGDLGAATYNIAGTNAVGLPPTQAVLQVYGAAVIGARSGSDGVFSHGGGATVNVGIDLTLGRDSGSSGRYTLQAPLPLALPPTLDVFAATFVGLAGTGQFDQLAGTHNTRLLVIGPLPGAVGTYNLSGGSLNITDGVVVGEAPGSTGTISVSGTGVLSAAAMNVNANGTLNYSGGQITLGTSSAPGTLTVAPGGSVYVTAAASSSLDFHGNVDNAGYVKITGASLQDKVVWNGKFINGSTYESDPATNIFMSDLIITPNGYLVGGAGDVFEVHGDFLNSSTNAAQWDTDLATLIFGGAGAHAFGVAYDGTTSAFKWGDIRAGAGVHLSFLDTSSINGMELWVDVLDLTDGLAAILLDPGEVLTIHYDPSNAKNAYLNAATDHDGVLRLAGSTSNVPEPATLALFGLGLVGLAASRRRRN